MKPKRHGQSLKDEDAAPRWGPALIGVVALGILSLSVYRGVVDIRSSSPKWDKTIHQDFPGLDAGPSMSSKQREKVIEVANHQPCPCGCVHTLASCLKSDLTCPIRSQNIAKVKDLIAEAAKTPAG